MEEEEQEESGFWGSIDLLHRVVSTLDYIKREHGTPLPTVTYRGKVKLHGCNCSVKITHDGLVPQSRNSILTAQDDLFGFAKWAFSHADFFRQIPLGITVFGEWCGPGIQKGTAVNQLPERTFAVFALTQENMIITDPIEIASLLKNPPSSLVVIPWEGESFDIDFRDPKITHVNEMVLAVEKEDPFIKKLTGVSGLGEGLVYYPISVKGTEKHDTPLVKDLAQWHLLAFKAKGEKHRNVKTKEAVTIDPVVAKSIADFVDLVVTEARLQQGLDAFGGVKDKKLTGHFVNWLATDVHKECQGELAASGLTWPQVKTVVDSAARRWFLS